MSKKNPIKKRIELLRLIQQRGLSQELCEKISIVMKYTAEECREKKAKGIISLIDQKTEAEIIKELDRNRGYQDGKTDID